MPERAAMSAQLRVTSVTDGHDRDVATERYCWTAAPEFRNCEILPGTA
jgi:hypothetical protein